MRARQNAPDQGLMTPMQTVERADGDDCATRAKARPARIAKQEIHGATEYSDADIESLHNGREND